MKRWLMPLLLIAAGISAYHNSFTGSFIFDDHGAIETNPQIRQLWPLSRARNSTPTAGRPVVTLSFALNYAVGGLNVWGYHAFNVGVHIGCALLLFGIARRTLTDQGALAIALIWVVHPLLTESVDYISQRTELVMALFYLLTLYCVIRGWFAGAIISCALGMASKEVMVSAPVVVLLYDRAFISHSFKEALRRHWKLYVGLAATWSILAALLATGPRTSTAGFGFAQLSPGQYARIQCQVIVHYLRLCFVPSPLALDYSDWLVPRLFPWMAVVVLTLLAATAWALWKRPKLGFLGAWSFLILAPTSSFLSIITEVAAERRMYLPLAAVVALVVAGSRRIRQPWLKSNALVALTVALVAMTIRRNEDYRTELSIWQDTVIKRPGNARAHNNLGTAFEHNGNLADAIQQYAEAARLNPNYAVAQNNWGAALDKLGHSDEALVHYREAVRLDPREASAQNNLSSALDRIGDHEAALTHFTEAVRLQPDFAPAHFNLATALERRGDLKGAAQHYAETVRLQPSLVEARQNLGIILAQLGRFDEAIAQFAEVLRLRPGSAEAEFNWGLVLQQQHRPQEATQHFAAALKLNPDLEPARRALESLRTQPNQ